MNNKELTKKTQEIKEILNNHIEFGGEETPNYHRIVGYNELVATLADYITKTTQSNDEIKREAVEHCVNELSGKPKCTEEEPCGCHFGEVFHSDGMCACDLVKKILGDLTQKENNE